MEFFEWIAERARHLDANQKPAPQPKDRPIVAPPAVDVQDEEELLQPDEDGQILLDEVYITIDYRDAANNQTRRRITLIKASKGPKAPMLSAICHERKAYRHFRTDRIICFIDQDGEIFEPTSFFRETLLINLASLAPDKNNTQKGMTHADPALERARELRDKLRAPLSLLVLAAKADDEFHEEELEVICSYIEDELWDLGTDVTIEELNQLTALVRIMRPTERTIEKHFATVDMMSSGRRARFNKALTDLIAADGVIDPMEEAFRADLLSAKERITDR